MKKLWYLLTAAAVVGLLCACTAGGAPSESGGQMANPMHKWSQEEFAEKCVELKVPVIAAPQEAEEVKYYTYDSGLAEIQFKSGGISYSYRASAEMEDISGLYVEYEEETGKVMIGAGEAEVKTIKGGGAVALWTREGVSFSLYGKDADASQLSAVAAALGGLEALQIK